MSLGEEVAAHLPYLRRYARALTGSQEAGDALVKATLEAAIGEPGLRAGLGQGRVALYKAFNRTWTNAAMAQHAVVGAGGAHEEAANERLQRITPANRQALLLISLEEFSCAQAGEIMGLEAEEIGRLAQDAIAEIDRESATSVLIIEDEPLIAMQLEELVAALGHKVSGVAATRSQAREAVSRSLPGLVLADIQLADGSSGLDAVDDVLALGTVPVVFVTAYPEQLLTGCRKEPTYLVTKPFREETVRAAISQALFFRSSEPVA